MKEIDQLQERITDAAIDALAQDDSTQILSEDVFEDMKQVVADTVAEIFAGTTIAEIDTLLVKCADAVDDMVDAFAISDYYDELVLNRLKGALSKAIASVNDEDEPTD